MRTHERSAGAARKSARRGSRRAAAGSVFQHLRELVRVSQHHVQRVEERCGISGAQLWALSELDAHPSMTVSELAQALLVHLSTASNLLAKLETQGLVRRERDAEDQRVVRVHPTRAGTRVLQKAPKPVDGVIPDALRRMPPATLARLEKDLGTLLEIANGRSRKAGVKPESAA